MFSFICFFINVQKYVVKKRWDKYNIKIKGEELQKKGFNLLIDFIPYNMLYMKNLRLNDFFDCFGVSGIHKFFVEIKKYKP